MTRRPRRATWAVLACTLALTTLVGCATPRATQMASTTPMAPSPTPALDPTATPTAAPSASQPSASVLAIDSIGAIAIGGLRLRTEPSTAAGVIGELPQDAGAFIVSGPVQADGHSWYEISGLGLPGFRGCQVDPTDLASCPDWYGWAAGDGPDGEAWIRPATNPCPSKPTSLAELFGVSPPLAVLSCFGHDEFTVEGYVPDLSQAGIGCAGWPGFTPAWLGPCAYFLLSDRPNGDMFFLYLDPASGPSPSVGQWVEIVGHFDDPAAQTCQGGDPSEAPGSYRDLAPQQLVLRCRQQFVVTDAHPIAALSG